MFQAVKSSQVRGARNSELLRGFVTMKLSILGENEIFITQSELPLKTCKPEWE